MGERRVEVKVLIVVKLSMPIISISRKMLSEKELVVVPRKEYEQLLQMQKLAKRHFEEIKDTDEAIAIYRKERKANKLEVLKSLSRLK